MSAYNLRGHAYTPTQPNARVNIAALLLLRKFDAGATNKVSQYDYWQSA